MVLEGRTILVSFVSQDLVLVLSFVGGEFFLSSLMTNWGNNPAVKIEGLCVV